MQDTFSAMEHSIGNLEDLTNAMQKIQHFFLPPPIDTPDLKIRGIGIYESMNPGICLRPGGTGDYLMMAFLDPVTIRTGNADQACAAGTMMIWDPKHGHCYGNSGQPWLHSWIHFDGREVGRLIDQTSLPINRPFALTNPAVVNQYLWEIYREVTGHSKPNAQIVLNSMHSWLLDMERQVSGAHMSAPRDLLALRNYLGENVHMPIGLAEMARRVNMSPSHFSAQFKHHFGVAPVEYHIQLRLHAAAYLLQDGNRPVADVARAVGYDDPFYFSRQFKARFRMSPREVRNSGATH